MNSKRRRPGPWAGVALLWRGFRMWSREPRLMWLGFLPGVITLAIFAVALATLLGNLRTVSEWVTDRITQSDAEWVGLLEIAVSLAILGGTILVVIHTFTAVTLLVGQPFFQRVSDHIDRPANLTAVPPESWWRSTGRGLAEGLGLLILTGIVALSLFLVSLVPLVGGITAAMLGAIAGGWFLALELTAYPFSRRGITRLRERSRTLRAHRPMVLGFGVSVFVLFLVPLGALFTMPAAVAGAALVVRRTLGEAMPEPDAAAPGATVGRATS